MPDLCLIVPCFNEAGRLPSDAFIRFLNDAANCAICFVNDGSSDGTAALLDALAGRMPDRISVLHLEHNAGKAEAVRRGMQGASQTGRFAILGYWDADLAAPLSEVAPMADTLRQHSTCRVVLGSRWKRLGSRIERSGMRHVLGRVFATIASLILGLPVYDSQCGAKLFRADRVAGLFRDPFCSRWSFDVEILARLHQQVGSALMHEAAIEYPLREWRHVGGSKLGFAQMAGATAELFTIYRRYPRR